MGPHRFWDELIVVEGHPRISRRRCAHHYSYREIDDDLGDDGWIISRCDSAIRSYGLLVVHRIGAERIVTLDDCYPVEGRDYLAGHLGALDRTPRWCSTVDDLVPRGIPYFHRGTLANVAINMGLWCGVPDQDAAHQLAAPVVDYAPPRARG